MKILWYLFLFFSTSSIAQFPQTPKALKYSTKDGLSFGIVNSIVQDNNGFMWIATDDGLNRFDGISFRIFRHDSEEKFSLPGNYINTVFKDSRGQLWITSRKGLLKFDASQEHFYPQSLYNGQNMDEDISSISKLKMVISGFHLLYMGYLILTHKQAKQSITVCPIPRACVAILF
jgi:hypothetical protein